MAATTIENEGKPWPRAAIPSASYKSPYLWSIGCVLIALAYYLLFFKYDIDLDDEGFLISGASAILHAGQLPLADFMSYPPLMYFSLAGFFHLFGETLLVERAFLIVHLLIDVACLLWISRKLLPMPAALLPVLFYAMAPGAWYKVFFIYTLLIVSVALLFFNERPSPPRALLLGLTIGLAAITRADAAAVSVAVFVGALFVVAFCDLRAGEGTGSVVRRGLANAAAGVAGLAFAPMLAAISYAATGKLQALVVNAIRYINPASYANAIAGRGLADLFRPWALVSDPRLEQWVYAAALAACLALVAVNAARLLVSTPEHFLRLRRRILLGAMAIASMGYTFFFVWNSRMLSTFAIVILAVVTLLYDAAKPLAPRWRLTVLAGSCAAIVAVIVNFSREVTYYSGSITDRIFFARNLRQYAVPKEPFLKGAVIWTTQLDTIDQLYHIGQTHPDATLVPMTECTTLGYLSGLRNPTYYRLFTAEEMPAEKGQEAAIRTFERDQITYFVARRDAFFSNDDPGAVDLAALPLVKNYLLGHYDLRPLGENYVILVRRGKS